MNNKIDAVYSIHSDSDALRNHYQDTYNVALRYVEQYNTLPADDRAQNKLSNNPAYQSYCHYELLVEDFHNSSFMAK